MVKDREVWHAAVHGVANSQTWFSPDMIHLTRGGTQALGSEGIQSEPQDPQGIPSFLDIQNVKQLGGTFKTKGPLGSLVLWNIREEIFARIKDFGFIK